MANLSFSYSKWDKLELSDDEETFHPNLDTGLNIRVNRITRDRKEEEIDKEKAELTSKGELDKAAKLEEKRPLHVNNVCQVVEERTIIQSSDGTKSDKLKKGEESFCVDDYSMFKSENKAILDRFANASWEESHEMLLTYGHILMQDYANSYYMLTALDEEMKGNHKMTEKLCRQGQIVSQIHQLAEPMKRPPRDLVPRFFEKFERDESRAAFQEGVDHFLKNLKKRAIDKKKEMEAEEKEEAAQAAAAPAQEDLQPVSLVEAMYEMTPEERKGPGGLDPIEVYESLPEGMQECFKTGDIPKLKQIASDMNPEEFQNHFQRCIDSGLWSSGG